MAATQAPRAFQYFDADTELECMPGYLFRVLENKANSLFQEAFAAHNITTRQFGVLITLARKGAMTQTELAERTSSDKCTLGEMVVRMSERGLLTRRRGSDKRSVMITITKAGKELADEVAPIAASVQSVILEALPEEYRMLFMKCLKQLAASRFEQPEFAR